MKQIKLILPVLALTILGMSASAQTTFGIRAGVNFSNINGKDDGGDNLENRITTGFHAGVNAEIPVAEDFYVQPGLLFSMKGAKTDKDALIDGTYRLGYIELPVNFLYKPVLGTGRLLLGVGPYFAYGVTGKFKNNDGDDVDIKFENAPSNPLNQDALYSKPFDAGANVLFGYEFANRLSAQLNAQLGLVNTNAYDTDAKVKNTVFGISLGYRFGGK
ncbi:PorT family protein [Nostoc ellipsosporum NOK]|jgi:hypothetical protein|nr:PorT family protein [Nostoc ellipsosporum NOK]